MARTRGLAFGLAAVVALAAARSTPAFYVPPPAPGQQINSWFPHTVQTTPHALVRDAAGGYLVGGESTLSGASHATLARFTASGAPDSAFGTGGALDSSASSSTDIVTPLADGRFLTATDRGPYIAIERRLADGRVDPTFSVYLWHATNLVQNARNALALTPLADGTIVAVLNSSRAQVVVQGPPEPGGLDILRLSADGALLSQTTYSAPEWVINGATAYDTWVGAHVNPDGSVVAAGAMDKPIVPPCPCTFHQEFVLRRFLPSGAVDPSFGRVTTELLRDTYAGAFTVAPNGELVLAGTTNGGSANDVGVARYLPDGTPDGTVVGPAGEGNAVAVAGDGSLFVASQNPGFVLKEAPGGTRAAFGANGVVALPSDRPWALLPESGGGVTVAATGSQGEYLVRVGPDGTRDTTFGSRAAPIGPPSQALAAVATRGPMIAAAGSIEDDSGRRGTHVAVVDLSTASGPVETTSFAGDGAKAVAIDSANRVVVGGDGFVARFVSGSPDPAFFTKVVGTVSALGVLPDDRILALAGTTVYRLTAAGAPDGAFPLGATGTGLVVFGDRAFVALDGLAIATVDSTGTVQRSDAAVPAAVPAAIAAERDGTVVVAGTTPAGMVLVRRAPDGTLDRAFGANGIAFRAGLDATGVALQRDGKIVAAVRDHANAGLAVARFLYDGRIDSTFGTGGLAYGNALASATAIAAGERGIVVAGSAPGARGSDSALALFYAAPLVYDLGSPRLIHVTPHGAIRTVAHGTQPAWSPRGLATVTDDDGGQAIAVNGGMVARSPLPGGVLVSGTPSWSPDGVLLALQLRDPDGTFSIGVEPAGGGTVRRLDAGSGMSWLSGHRLAYVLDGTVRIVNADTGVSRAVTLGIAVAAPAKGALLAVVRPEGVLMTRLSGRVVARLPETFGAPVWSPDGTQLAGFDGRYLAFFDTRGHERRTHIRRWWGARGLAWSPDGRRLAFVNMHHTLGIVFVDARTGRQIGRPTSERGFAGGNPTWDPTGVYITAA